MSEAEKEKNALQWHPAFYAGIQIELAEEAHLLIFENEHQLGTKPKEIDVLIIKKDSNVAIKKNLGRIFRKHNIIEYKNPEDYLSIDDFYKVYGYACFYKSDTKKVNEIKVKEITISFVTERYPGKVMKHLERERHLQIQKQEKGIYYLYGDCFPIQFIVTSQLTEEMNFWLHSLTSHLKETSRAERIIREYQGHQNENLHKSVMNIIVTANKKIFEEAGTMCEALYEIAREKFQKRLEEEVQKEMEEKIKKEVEEKIEKEVEAKIQKEVEAKIEEREEKSKAIGQMLGKEQTLMSLVKDSLLSITEAAKRLSITEEELRQKMEQC